MQTYNASCAARAAEIEREQWEQFPEIMRSLYGSPKRAAPEQSGATGHKPRQKRKSKLLRILCRLLK
jgi:hypothetical protein